MVADIGICLTAIESELRAVVSSREAAVAPLYQMMQYHLGWVNAQFEPQEGPRGKRLRPLMCLLGCEAVGGYWPDALAAAATVELIHNFSLLHDDIEDDSPTRRHRATAWSLWGIPQGINTGDGMWALARLVSHRLSRKGHRAERVLRVMYLLDTACLDLCAGQYLDIAFETLSQVSLEDYQRMIRGKTAALLSAAVAAGAVLGGADGDCVERCAAFGREFGFVFQITDDILGIWGDQAVTGKSVASDIQTRKKTLPVLYALEREAQRGDGELARLYARPGASGDDVGAVLSILNRAGALEYAREQAQQHFRAAGEHLRVVEGQTGPSGRAAQAALLDLASSLLDRSF